MQTADYLDAARARAGIPSDYALAARLGVSRGAVSNWRVGRGFPEPLHAFELAELAGVDPARMVADLELQRAEREHRDATAAGWRSILQRLGGAAAAVVMVAGLGVVPSPSQASNNGHRVNPESGCILCKVPRRRRPGGRAVMAALARALLGSPMRAA